MLGAFDLLCDQLLDDLVREGKEVLPGLKSRNRCAGADRSESATGSGWPLTQDG
jgi:hypothetical protein